MNLRILLDKQLLCYLYLKTALGISDDKHAKLYISEVLLLIHVQHVLHEIVTEYSNQLVEVVVSLTSLLPSTDHSWPEDTSSCFLH